MYHEKWGSVNTAWQLTDWGWSRPLRSTDTTSKMKDKSRKWFTVALTRTMIHGRYGSKDRRGNKQQRREGDLNTSSGGKKMFSHLNGIICDQTRGEELLYSVKESFFCLFVCFFRFILSLALSFVSGFCFVNYYC